MLWVARNRLGRSGSAQVLYLLLHIALNEGQRLVDLIAVSKGRPSTVSRQLLDLAGTRRDGRPGHGLVEIRLDPLDPCANNYYLTPSGEAFIAEIVAAMNGAVT